MNDKQNENKSFGFREHGIMLYLGKTAYLGFIQFQAKEELGRSYAAQQIFTEGLFARGFLTQEQHDSLMKRYSEKLMPKPEPQPVSQPKTVIPKKPKIDYPKMTFEELQTRYDKAKEISERGESAPELQALAFFIKQKLQPPVEEDLQ